MGREGRAHGGGTGGGRLRGTGDLDRGLVGGGEPVEGGRPVGGGRPVEHWRPVRRRTLRVAPVCAAIWVLAAASPSSPVPLVAAVPSLSAANTYRFAPPSPPVQLPATPPSPTQPASSTDEARARLADLTDYIDGAMHDWDIPGMAVAVVYADEVVFARGFGVKELGRGDPVVNGKGGGHDPTSHQQSSFVPCHCGLM